MQRLRKSAGLSCFVLWVYQYLCCGLGNNPRSFYSLTYPMYRKLKYLDQLQRLAIRAKYACYELTLELEQKQQ